METIKKWITRFSLSKTMWFGLAISILGVVQANSDILSTVLTPKQYGWLMLGIGIVIKLLRFVTTKPLEDK